MAFANASPLQAPVALGHSLRNIPVHGEEGLARDGRCGNDGGGFLLQPFRTLAGDKVSVDRTVAAARAVPSTLALDAAPLRNRDTNQKQSLQ